LRRAGNITINNFLRQLFGIFFGLFTAGSDGLFAAVNPPLNDSELIFGNNLDDPIPACLKAVLDNEKPARTDITLGKRKSPMGRYPANRAGGIRLGAFRCQRVRDKGIKVIFWCILPEQTGPGMKIQAFLT
jgi:hypothetical protein